MKKIIPLIFAFLLLCGCGERSRSQPQYLISALGFDYSQGFYTVTAEAVVINSDNAETERKTLIGMGENIPLCLDEIYRKSTQKAEFSHCTAIVLGQSVSSGEKVTEILDFCYSRDQINLAARFVTAKNAQKLLSAKPVSSVAVGFDIADLLSEYKDTTKTDYKSKFYQLEAAKFKTDTLYFPTVFIKDGGLYLGDIKGVVLNEN